MTKLEFLKKMYVEGRLVGKFGEEDISFDSLENLLVEIKATIKRMSDIDELERPTEAKEDPKAEKSAVKEFLNDAFDEYAELLKKEGWKIKTIKHPDLFYEFDWLLPRRFRR